MNAGDIDTDVLIEFVNRLPIFEALQQGCGARAELARRLDVSRATSYRFADWLNDEGLISSTDSGFELTELGERIARAVSTFATTVRETFEADAIERELVVDVVRLSPALAAFDAEPLSRRELEEQLEISKTTGYRFTRTLDDLNLVERSGRFYTLTTDGMTVAEATVRLNSDIRLTLRLAPLLEVRWETTPPIDVDAFAHSTITSADQGDPYAPFTRFVSLVEDSDSIRGINTCRIAPTYIAEFQNSILNGMSTELIHHPEVTEDIMERYPEKCVQVCISEYLSLWIHPEEGALPLGIVLFDDRVGVGIFETDGDSVTTFFDTDDAGAIDWANDVYDQYRSESVYLEEFTKTGLRAVTANY